MSKRKIIFQQAYYGENLHDYIGELDYLFEEDFLHNKKDGLHQGGFVITVEWDEDE